MEIINLLDPTSHDVEAPLLAMASSEDRLEGFKGQKLLELVRYLRANGHAPRACGHFLQGELWLTPYSTANRVLVKVWVDWRDYATLHGGMPDAHYRLQAQRGQSPLSNDARATTPEEVERFIWEAFGWR